VKKETTFGFTFQVPCLCIVALISFFVWLVVAAADRKYKLPEQEG